MTRLCLAGRFQEASAIQLKYMDFIDALFLDVNPIPIKAAMNLAGYGVGSLRLPLCDMSGGPPGGPAPVHAPAGPAQRLSARAHASFMPGKQGPLLASVPATHALRTQGRPNFCSAARL